MSNVWRVVSTKQLGYLILKRKNNILPSNLPCLPIAFMSERNIQRIQLGGFQLVPTCSNWCPWKSKTLWQLMDGSHLSRVCFETTCYTSRHPSINFSQPSVHSATFPKNSLQLANLGQATGIFAQKSPLGTSKTDANLVMKTTKNGPEPSCSKRLSPSRLYLELVEKPNVRIELNLASEPTNKISPHFEYLVCLEIRKPKQGWHIRVCWRKLAGTWGNPSLKKRYLNHQKFSGKAENPLFLGALLAAPRFTPKQKHSWPTHVDWNCHDGSHYSR